ncbi:MAG: acyl-CoA thioesterase II [Pseudomonadales bacterium]|jgi:acyl-CoA thioesterase-2|tara:strand:+ start:407 stop:1267 length:861 start_codon:yes stop_codon:yes gene_type:complete
MSEAIAVALRDKLTLEQLDLDLFRAQNEATLGERLFGGQVLAQALSAAQHTIADRPCHSLHGYFLRPGKVNIPVIFQVERIRDGKSFSTRRIMGIQNGQAIFSMDASFQTEESGLHHQMDIPPYPAPEDLEDDRQVAMSMTNLGPHGAWMTRERPFEMRSVVPIDQVPIAKTRQAVWIRFLAPIPEATTQQQLLAYASDMGLVSTSALPHRPNIPRDRLQMASLDHSLWFHDHLDLTDWLLYVKDTPVTFGNRGLNRGSFFDQSGRRVASVIQEGLMRVAPAPDQG